MGERFEVAARKAQQGCMDAALLTTLARAEHVWMRLDTMGGAEWLPGVLVGWTRQSGRLMGHVVVVRRWWDQLSGDWRSARWEQLVEPEKLRPARAFKIGPEAP